jgi:hypothetical protein
LITSLFEQFAGLLGCPDRLAVLGENLLRTFPERTQILMIKQRGGQQGQYWQQTDDENFKANGIANGFRAVFLSLF